MQFVTSTPVKRCHRFGRARTYFFKPVEVEDPIASSPEAQSFREAVQRGDMEAAKNVFDSGNDELKKYCGEYLVSLGSSRLVELINGANDMTSRNGCCKSFWCMLINHSSIKFLVNSNLQMTFERCCKQCRLGLHASKIHLPSQQN